jgi:hypothetical protein
MEMVRSISTKNTQTEKHIGVKVCFVQQNIRKRTAVDVNRNGAPSNFEAV